jgi:hypothetical protein
MSPRPASILLACVAVLPFVAATAEAQAPTASQEAQTMRNMPALTEAQARAELGYLSPAVRVEVERRATGGNTLRGVMETMLLNNVSQLFASSKVVAVDFTKGVVVVEGTNGQIRAYPFDVTTLQLRS